MKSIWRTNPNGPLYWPSQNALDAEKALGITDVFFPLMKKNVETGKYVFNDIEINTKYRQDISTHFGYRIYYDPSWDSEIHAPMIVGNMHDAVMSVGGVKGVMWDIEYHHSSDLIIEVITLWRQKHPTGPIAWTMEPFQAGWMTDAVVSKVNHDVNMVVVPQNFYYNMDPAGIRNGKDVRQELIVRGFASNRVKFFYDGARSLPSTWDGCILSEETLPTYK